MTKRAKCYTVMACGVIAFVALILSKPGSQLTPELASAELTLKSDRTEVIGTLDRLGLAWRRGEPGNMILVGDNPFFSLWPVFKTVLVFSSDGKLKSGHWKRVSGFEETQGTLALRTAKAR